MVQHTQKLSCKKKSSLNLKSVFQNDILYGVFCDMGQKDQEKYYAKKCMFFQLLTWNTPIKKTGNIQKKCGAFFLSMKVIIY